MGGRGKGGERGEDVEGPGKWSAPGPVGRGGSRRACILDFDTVVNKL